MGSFNLTCFVSKVTIASGDRVYMIPLKYNPDYCPRNNTLINTHEMFQVVMLPIIGTYNDYGEIDPEVSELTIFLERHYKRPIASIIDAGNKLYDMAVFIHESVYDAMAAQLYRDYDGKKKEDYDYEKEFCWYGDALKNEMTYVVKSCKYYKTLLPTQPKENHVDVIDLINNYREQLINYSFRIAGRTPFFKIWLDKFPILQKTFTKIFITGKLKETMIKFAKFDYNLYCTNCAYTPPAMGQQYGNHYMVRQMLRAATKLNNEKIAKDKANRDE